MTDLSEARRRFTQQGVDEAVSGVVASRWWVEQAKGVVMASGGVDADTAFELLVQASQEHNVKVRDIAAALLESLGAGDDEVARTRARDRLRLTIEQDSLGVVDGCLTASPRHGSLESTL